MRPLCGIQRDGNRKSQGALARSRSGRVCRRQRTAPLCEFPGSAAQRNPRDPVLKREAHKNKNQGAKRPLIPLPLLQTHPRFFHTPFSPSQNRLNPPSPPPKSDTHQFLLTRAILRNFLYVKKSGAKPALFLQNPLVCSFLMFRAPRRSPSSSLRVRLRFPCAAFRNPTARSSASASL